MLVTGTQPKRMFTHYVLRLSQSCMLVTCRPHHPWELLTGSLDASVKRWNFSQGRSVRHWRMEPTEEHNNSQVTLICPSTPRHIEKDVIPHPASKIHFPREDQHGHELYLLLETRPPDGMVYWKLSGALLQAFNPPLVHSVAVACPDWARQLGRLVAVARGDGLVVVYDADQPQQAPQHRKVTKVRKRPVQALM